MFPILTTLTALQLCYILFIRFGVAIFSPRPHYDNGGALEVGKLVTRSIA